MRSGVEGIPWKHGPPARDTSARAGVTAFGPGRWCDEHNLVGSAALGCINGHPGQAKRKSRLRGDIDYADPGVEAYEAQHRSRTLRNLRNRVQRLGLGLIDRETGELMDPGVS